MTNILRLLVVLTFQLTFFSQTIFSKPREATIGVIELSDTPDIHNFPKRRLIIEKAIELAVASYKEILKKRDIEVSLKYFDIKSIPTGAIQEVKLAIDSNAIVAIGLSTSNTAKIAADLFGQKDLTIISPYATESGLREHYPKFILLPPDNDSMAETMVKLAKKVSHRRLAIVAWDCPYCRNLFQLISRHEKNDVKLIRAINDSENMNRLALEVIQEKPDLIYLPNFSLFSSQVISALSKKGFRGIFVGGDGWGDSTNGPFYAGINKQPFQGFMVTNFTIHDPPNGFDLFSKKFEESIQTYPKGIACYYYDTFALVLEKIMGIKGTITRDKMNQALKDTITFNGKFGKYCLNKSICSTESQLKVLKLDENGIRLYDNK